MGLFQKLFPGKTAALKQASSFFETLNLYTPAFSSWRGMIYEHLQVRSAIDALARNSSKLELSISGSAKPALQTKLRHGPNEFQTWSQFLYQARTILEIDTTLFIVPVYDRFGAVSGIFPVTPTNTQVVESAGKIYLQYQFSSGQQAAIELENCAVLTRFQYRNEFFGSGNAPMNETLDLIHYQNQGIKEGIKNAASYRLMAQHAVITDPEDLKAEQDKFAEMHFKKGSGILLLPKLYQDVKQIDAKPFVIDAEQKKLIDQNIYQYFGVNEDVLQNKAYGDGWSAFYEGAIEPFSIQLSETLTKMLFTFREQSAGARVMFTSNRLQFMSDADKLKISEGALDRGYMNRDEVRAIWNLPPLPNGEGQIFIVRGEYYNASEKLEEVSDDGSEQNDTAEAE